MSDPVEPFVQQCLDELDRVANMTPTVPPGPTPTEWVPVEPTTTYALPDPITPGPPPPPAPVDPDDPSPGVP